MAKVEHASVDAYLRTHPPGTRSILEKVRAAIRKALPGAEEVISYQIPTYKLGGRAVIYFAGWKDHYSVYPASAELVEALADALAPYEVRKGTVRFPLTGRVPVGLIGKIAKLRAKQAAAGTRVGDAPKKAKAAAPKKAKATAPQKAKAKAAAPKKAKTAAAAAKPRASRTQRPTS